VYIPYTLKFPRHVNFADFAVNSKTAEICGSQQLLSVLEFLLSTRFENDDCALHSKQLQRGHRVYKDIWDPPVSEIVFCERENRSPRDSYAVALRKDSITIGRVPRAIRAFTRSSTRCFKAW